MGFALLVCAGDSIKVHLFFKVTHRQSTGVSPDVPQAPHPLPVPTGPSHTVAPPLRPTRMQEAPRTPLRTLAWVTLHWIRNIALTDGTVDAQLRTGRGRVIKVVPDAILAQRILYWFRNQLGKNSARAVRTKYSRVPTAALVDRCLCRKSGDAHCPSFANAPRGNHVADLGRTIKVLQQTRESRIECRNWLPSELAFRMSQVQTRSAIERRDAPTTAHLALL
jgi:hypothetical protein